MIDEVYVLCLSYVDNFEVFGVYTDYLEAEKAKNDLIKYSIFDEAEQQYHIYRMSLNKYYNYKEFERCEVF